MSEQEKHSQPKTYECVDAGSQFGLIADHILEIFGTSEGDYARSAVWSDNGGYDQYSLLRYHRHDSPHTAYNLVHNDKRFSEDSWTRYAVIFSDDKVTQVMLNNDGKHVIPLDPEAQRHVSRQALEILAEKAPNALPYAQNTVFEKAFAEVAANFVLSDFADENEGERLTEVAARRAVSSFHTWMAQTKSREEVNAAAADKPKVYRAARTSPEANSRGRYLSIELLETVLRLARDMEYEWPHRVNDKLDHHENERYVKIGGNHE